MTFAEYNTDENFNAPSNAMELVRLGKEEGKTREEISNSLSPLWKEDKKGNVKKALDYHFKEETAPKAEEKKVETPKKEEPKKETPSSLSSGDKKYMKEVDDLADSAEKKELSKIKSYSDENFDELYSTLDKQGKAFGSIDDHMVSQLPTFMIKRYMDGEFGDPKSSDAKLRLTHFMLNGVQSKLRQASNAAAIAAGRSPIYNSDETTSDYEKYQSTNLAQGLENRWNKYKEETNAAMELAKKEGMNEQDARLAVQTLTRNNTLNTKWNMMNEKQKLYAMEITKEMGDYIGNLNLDEIANFVAGAALNEGQNNISKDEVVAIGIAKLAAKSPEILNNLPEGDMKNVVFSIVASMIGGNPTDVIAGLGGAGGSKKDEGSGDDLNIGLKMNDDEYAKLESKADALSADLYNGKIGKNEFVKEYDKLVAEMNKHPVYKAKTKKTILSTKDILNANKNLELKAKFGEDTKSKTFKNGKKAVDYFNNKTSLFDYFKNTAEPNYIDAKAATKNKDYKMKEYQEALAQFEILKNADAINLVGKY